MADSRSRKQILRQESLSKAVIDAAKNGQLQVIKRLVAAGAEVTSSDSQALRFAAANSHLDTLEYLISKRADVNANEDEALRNAVTKGSIDVVKYLLDVKANVNSQEGNILRIAAETKDIELIKVLIATGADVNAMNDQALINAVSHKSVEIVKHLLDVKANVNAQQGKSLVIAVENGYFDLVKILTSAAADVHLQNGRSFQIAAVKGSLETLKHLVEFGCKQEELNAAFVESCKGKNMDVIKYLIGLGADVHHKKDRAIVEAATNGRLQVLKFLIECGCDPTTSNNKAFILACQNNRPKVVKYLISIFPDVIKAQNYGGLVRCATWSRFDLLEYLLSKGADIHAQNDYALREFFKNKKWKGVDICLHHGANIHAYNNEIFREAVRQKNQKYQDLVMQSIGVEDGIRLAAEFGLNEYLDIFLNDNTNDLDDGIPRLEESKSKESDDNSRALNKADSNASEFQKVSSKRECADGVQHEPEADKELSNQPQRSNASVQMRYNTIHKKDPTSGSHESKKQTSAESASYQTNSYSAGFVKVMQFIQSGKTPDDIRDDIDDSASNPDAVPSQSQLPIPRKPWEKIEEENALETHLRKDIASLKSQLADKVKIQKKLTIAQEEKNKLHLEFEKLQSDWTSEKRELEQKISHLREENQKLRREKLKSSNGGGSVALYNSMPNIRRLDPRQFYQSNNRVDFNLLEEKIEEIQALEETLHSVREEYEKFREESQIRERTMVFVSQGLARSLATKLVKNGIHNFEDLEFLSDDHITKLELGLGDQLALKRAVKRLQSNQAPVVIHANGKNVALSTGTGTPIASKTNNTAIIQEFEDDFDDDEVN